MAVNQRGIQSKHGPGDPHPRDETALSPRPAMIALARLLARLLAKETAVAQPTAPAKRAAKIAGPSLDIPIARDRKGGQDNGR